MILIDEYNIHSRFEKKQGKHVFIIFKKTLNFGDFKVPILIHLTTSTSLTIHNSIYIQCDSHSYMLGLTFYSYIVLVTQCVSDLIRYIRDQYIPRWKREKLNHHI